MLSLEHDVEISVVLRDAKDFCVVFQSVLGDDSSYNISSIPEVNIRGTHFFNPLPKHISLIGYGDFSLTYCRSGSIRIG
jgi:hypothetical protein